MFKQLKNVSVYRASLPALADLEAAIEGNEALTRTDALGAEEMTRFSFIHNPVTSRYVTPLLCGYSLCVLVQEKILPAAAIKSEVDRKVRDIEESQCRSVRRKERLQIKDEVMLDLLPRALTKERIIHAFYDANQKNLFVDNTSDRYSSAVLKLVVMADGKVTTSTVHISDQKQGLTTRLTAHLNGDSEPFGAFELGSNLHLKNAEDGTSVTFKDTEFPYGDDEYQLLEKIGSGASVHQIQLDYKGLRFTLTDKFHIKGVIDGDDQVAEFDNQDEEWMHFANARVFTLSKIVEHLCEMFGYKAPVMEQQNDSTPAPAPRSTQNTEQAVQISSKLYEARKQQIWLGGEDKFRSLVQQYRPQFETVMADRGSNNPIAAVTVLLENAKGHKDEGMLMHILLAVACELAEPSLGDAA